MFRKKFSAQVRATRGSSKDAALEELSGFPDARPWEGLSFEGLAVYNYHILLEYIISDYSILWG